MTVLLTRITFPYLLFISLVSLMAGVLNSLGRFAAAAATPILLNICLIGAVLWLTPVMASAGHALAWGVALAGAVQFIWLLIHCAGAGMSLRLRPPKLTPDVRKMVRRIIPGAVGAGVYQINLVIDMVIASLLPAGSISYLFFADRVNQLPLGVVGVAIGTALLPLMSRQIRSGDDAGALASQNRALEFSLILTLPAAIALMIIAEPVIRVLFERGHFTADMSLATAQALAVYAAGLPAYVLIKGLTPGFFAREDTVTPVKVAVIALVMNLVLNLILMGPFKHVGIAAATAASAWLNAILLAWILRRRGHFSLDARLKSRLPRMVLASVAMGAVLWVVQEALAAQLTSDMFSQIMALTALVVSGFVVYAVAALITGAVKREDLKRLRNH